MSPRAFVSHRYPRQQRQYRSDGCACRFARNARATPECRLSERLFSDRTIIRAKRRIQNTCSRLHLQRVDSPGYSSLPEGLGWTHCVPLIPRYTLDKLANDYRLREMHLVPFASRSALDKHARLPNFIREFFHRVSCVAISVTLSSEISECVSWIYATYQFFFFISDIP